MQKKVKSELPTHQGGRLFLIWWAASTSSRCSSTWLCTATGLRPVLYYYQSSGLGRVTWSVPVPHWPCSSPPNGIPSSQVRLASLSSMQSFSASMVSYFCGPHTSLLINITYCIGQDLNSSLRTLIHEAWQHNQPILRTLPFCLRTPLRQNLFQLTFFHSKHLAIFFFL